MQDIRMFHCIKTQKNLPDIRLHETLMLPVSVSCLYYTKRKPKVFDEQVQQVSTICDLPSEFVHGPIHQPVITEPVWLNHENNLIITKTKQPLKGEIYHNCQMLQDCGFVIWKKKH